MQRRAALISLVFRALWSASSSRTSRARLLCTPAIGQAVAVATALVETAAHRAVVRAPAGLTGARAAHAVTPARALVGARRRRAVRTEPQRIAHARAVGAEAVRAAAARARAHLAARRSVARRSVAGRSAARRSASAGDEWVARRREITVRRGQILHSKIYVATMCCFEIFLDLDSSSMRCKFEDRDRNKCGGAGLM